MPAEPTALLEELPQQQQRQEEGQPQSQQQQQQQQQLPKTWRQYYTEEELAHGWRLKLKGALGAPIFVLWYFALAALLGLLTAAVAGGGEGATSAEEVASPPLAIQILQAVLALFGVFAFVLQSVLLPPNKTDDIYHAQALIGSWVFLTRHCLTLQAVHLVASFLAGVLGSSFLARTTNCISLWMAGLGWFVTVQYFSLVHFNPEFVKTCAAKLARDPPYPLRTLCIWVHVFALPLAVLDVAVARQHGVLRADSSIIASLVMIVFYILFYIGLISTNFRATGYWPYAFLKELTTIGKWINFLVAQSVIITVFCLISWGLCFLPSAW